MDENIEIFTRLWEHAENEVVEFKKAETNFDVDELGKYFSASAMKLTCVNANLAGLYLVCGIRNMRLLVPHSKMVKWRSTN
ncbi:hypothetical protein BFINE_21810 [Bacteroides finegoldii DSM 17565]|nr:hypothetical protein BFINE_21810 [Bacteroides finegoldii DSM 17565]